MSGTSTHRRFIHDQEVSLQGMALIARKDARGGLDFEQPQKKRPGLHAGRPERSKKGFFRKVPVWSDEGQGVSGLISGVPGASVTA